MFKTVYSVTIGVLMMNGCLSSTTIEEYNDQGILTKKTHTSENMVASIERLSMKDKTLVVWSDGWGAEISGQFDPRNSWTPTGKMKVWNEAAGFATISNKSPKNLPAVIQSLSMLAKDKTIGFNGVTSTTNQPMTDNPFPDQIDNIFPFDSEDTTLETDEQIIPTIPTVGN